MIQDSDRSRINIISYIAVLERKWQDCWGGAYLGQGSETQNWDNVLIGACMLTETLLICLAGLTTLQGRLTITNLLWSEPTYTNVSSSTYQERAIIVCSQVKYLIFDYGYLYLLVLSIPWTGHMACYGYLSSCNI